MKKLPPLSFGRFQANLPLVRETADVLAKPIRTPAETAELLSDLRPLAQEAFVVLTLNTRYKVIQRHLVSLGIIDGSLVHPREVFRAAIVDGAAAIIMAHNHPSGDPSPSAEDLRITRQLVEAGRVLQIEVLDHVIIGRQPEHPTGFISLRESGLVAFNT